MIIRFLTKDKIMVDLNGKGSREKLGETEDVEIIKIYYIKHLFSFFGLNNMVKFLNEDAYGI